MSVLLYMIPADVNKTITTTKRLTKPTSFIERLSEDLGASDRRMVNFNTNTY